MTLQLQKIPEVLQILNEKLQTEYEIKDKVVCLVEEGHKFSDHIYTTLATQRKNLVEIVENLKKSNVSDVDVSELKLQLKEFSQALLVAEEKATRMKTHTHVSVEDLRLRINSVEKDIKSTEYDIRNLTEKIKMYENEIEESTREAAENEREEKELRELASLYRTEAEDRRKRGFATSLLALAAGTVTAPLTGGLSLVAAGGVAGFSLGYLLTLAKDCDDKADNLRRKAENERQKARQNEERMLQCKRKQRSLSSDQTNLRNRKDQMSDATTALKQVESHLCGTINIIQQASLAVQDLETDLHKIDLQSDTFKVVQKSLVNNPVKVQNIAQKQLDTLRGKLQGLRDLLVQLLPQEAIQ